jgi:hypothetical protein
MEDNRLKRNVNLNRSNRAGEDASRAPAHEMMAGSVERKRAFRNEWQQEALPIPPEIPGFHLCWLSTTNSYDPIHKRMSMGYVPVKAEEVPGFEHLKVKSGEHVGFISVNEMLLFKLPMEIYQDAMTQLHHEAPMEEQEKVAMQQEQLLNARDSNGKNLGMVEGDGMKFDMTRQAPLFE